MSKHSYYKLSSLRSKAVHVVFFKLFIYIHIYMRISLNIRGLIISPWSGIPAPLMNLNIGRLLFSCVTLIPIRFNAKSLLQDFSLKVSSPKWPWQWCVKGLVGYTVGQISDLKPWVLRFQLIVLLMCDCFVLFLELSLHVTPLLMTGSTIYASLQYL